MSLDFQVPKASLFIYFLITAYYYSVSLSEHMVQISPGKTKKGELSIFPRSFTVLSHCLHMLPTKERPPRGTAEAPLTLKVWRIRCG